MRKEREKEANMANMKNFNEEDFNCWMKMIDVEEKFSEVLMKKIKESGMSNVEFYKKAHIDRKLFSAFKNNPYHHPLKKSVIACCIALGLNLHESQRLLELAGYHLHICIPWDRVIVYCINTGVTDIDVVNEMLYHADHANSLL